MLRLSAVLGVVGISFAAIFVRLADLSPATVTFFRVAYALPLVGSIWLVRRHLDGRSRRSRLVAVAAGVVFAVDLTLWHASIGMIGAGLGTVLVSTQVVFVGVIAWIAHGERPSRRAMTAVPVMLVGVALIAGVGGAGYGDDPLLGAIVGLVAAVAYAGFIVLLRAANRLESTPPSGPLLDATAGAAAATLLWSFFETDFSLTPTWPAHGWIILLAVISQTVGWLLVSRSLPRLPALETSVLILVQPVGALLWSRLIFDEALSMGQWAGVAIVLGGVLAVAGRSTDTTRVRSRSAARSPVT